MRVRRVWGSRVRSLSSSAGVGCRASPKRTPVSPPGCGSSDSHAPRDRGKQAVHVYSAQSWCSTRKQRLTTTSSLTCIVLTDGNRGTKRTLCWMTLHDEVLRCTFALGVDDDPQYGFQTDVRRRRSVVHCLTTCFSSPSPMSLSTPLDLFPSSCCFYLFCDGTVWTEWPKAIGGSAVATPLR